MSPSNASAQRRTPPPFPLFIDLSGAAVTVVGAGAVAERKIATLLDHGAHVTVVAPEATEAVRAWARDGKLAWRNRPYRTGDLEGALLAIGATSNRTVNEAVHAEACARTMLVNIVDVPDLCNAIVPSVMRRGSLQIAVSTAGAAPSVARDVRRELELRYPAYWERYLDVLGNVRALIKQRVEGPAEKRAPLYEATVQGNLLERIAAGENPSAEEVYNAFVEPLLAKADVPSCCGEPVLGGNIASDNGLVIAGTAATGVPTAANIAEAACKEATL